MKSRGAIMVLLAASVALVAGIVGVARTGRTPMSSEQEQAVRTLVQTNVNVRIAREEIPSAVAEPEAKPKFKWSEIESADYRLYVAHLRSIGCPEATLRDIIIADVKKLFASREAPLKPKTASSSSSSSTSRALDARAQAADNERRQKLREVQLEKRALIKELLGVEIEIEPLRTSNSRKYEMFDAAFNALPVEKREAVRALQENYWTASDALDAKYGATGQNYRTNAAFREEYKTLNDNRRAELTKLLTPDQIEDFDMRTTNTGNALRKRLGNFDFTEQEFRELFRIEKQFNLALGGIDAVPKTATRDEVEASTPKQKADEQIRAVLGAERFAEYKRSQDSYYTRLLAASERYGFDKDAAIKAYDMQKEMQKQQTQISRDTTLTPQQRSAAMNDLRSNHEKALAGVIGERPTKAMRNYSSAGVTIY